MCRCPRRTFNIVLKWLLAATTASAPVLSWAAQPSIFPANFQITPTMVSNFQAEGYSRALTLARYGANSLELKTRALDLSNVVGHSVFNDVFQTSLIMFFAATAQLTKNRMEKARLLDGHELKFDEVKAVSVQAAQDLLCSSSAQTAGVRGEVLCSGEFWMGTIGGWGSRVAVQVTVMQVLKAMLRNNPTRAALIQLVGSFAASVLTLGGFLMSSHLWTEAAQIAVTNSNGSIDKQKEELSHNLFGRAVEHWASGDWKQYITTPDGQLADEILGNMHNILRVDSSLRNAWIYNGWRFGVARGDLIINLSVIMVALSAGTSLGASTGALISSSLGATGIGAWAIGAVASFACATAFGVGVSYSSVYFPDLEIGAKLTRAIQNTRGWFANNVHKATQSQLQAVSSSFDVTENHDVLDNLRGIPDLRTDLPDVLQRLRADRQGWANIAMEKYYELSQKVNDAQDQLVVIREVISSSILKDQITVNQQGELMTLALARQKYCPNGSGQNCDFPLAYQLQKLDTAQRIIDQGNQVLGDMASQILDVYAGDLKILAQFKDNKNVYFPMGMSEMAGQLATETSVVDVVYQILTNDFASLHDSVRLKTQVRFDSEQLRQNIAAQSKGIFGSLYLHGIDDQQLYLDMARSLGAAQ